MVTVLRLDEIVEDAETFVLIDLNWFIELMLLDAYRTALTRNIDNF